MGSHHCGTLFRIICLYQTAHIDQSKLLFALSLFHTITIIYLYHVFGLQKFKCDNSYKINKLKKILYSIMYLINK